MKTRFRLESIKQLLDYISRLTDQQKKALRTLLKNVSEAQKSRSYGMPSVISGTGSQWGEYLIRQRSLLDRLTSNVDQLIPVNEYRFLVQDPHIIDLAQRIDHGTGYWRSIRRVINQNPLLEVLIASRIVADQDSSLRDVYNQLVDALAGLAKPSITLSDKSEVLIVIEHRIIILSRHFNFAWLDASVVNRVIFDAHQCSYQDHNIVMNNDRLTESRPFRTYSGLQIWIGSAFCRIVDDALSNHDYFWLKLFARDTYYDFDKASSADQFISCLRSNSMTLDGLHSVLTDYDLKLLISNSDAKRVYRLAKRYSHSVHRICSDLATLSPVNIPVKFTNIVNVIEHIPRLRNHPAVQEVADYINRIRYNYDNQGRRLYSAFDSLINNHLYVSSLFDAMIHQLVNSNNTSEWRDLISFVRKDLKRATSLRDFIKRLLNYINRFDGRIIKVVNYYLVLALRFHDNYEINAVYNVVHDHPDVSNMILNDLASLNNQNESTNLTRIAKKIQGSELNLISITRIIANSALRIANDDYPRRYLDNQDDARQIFNELINHSNYISLLFRLVVNRLLYSPVSLKVRRKINFVEFYFNQSRTFHSFIKRFSRLIFGIHGSVFGMINYLTCLMLKHPDNQLDRLYKRLYNHRFIVDQILETLAHLSAAEKRQQLAKIARNIRRLGLSSVGSVRFLLMTVLQMASSDHRKHNATMTFNHYKKHFDNKNYRYVNHMSTDHLLSNMNQLINKLDNEIKRS